MTTATISPAGAVLETRGLGKRFMSGGEPLEALRDVSLQVAAGDYMAIVGSSGSGKSTLMNILGCLDRPTRGEVLFEGVSITGMSPSALAGIRNRRIGFVFQNYSLLPKLTALDNVAQPLVFAGVRAAERRDAAASMLERVGLSDRRTHFPSQLSGGQQQRVAVARALVTRPALILADEPTGNLDLASRESVLSLFEALNQEGNTIVIVTHDPDIAARCHRVVEIRDGQVVP
ncbi:ABC transporter ATP-binding protein [Stenotrophomonas sp.]|uniref:ABC transporter ATP-binding protein n=1 Tax=Stenotrophomonas sp. TaxID=69392 RepID=UPI002FCA65C0